MFNCKCLCCPKIGITQDQYPLIAKGLDDLAFTCSRCQREAMDVLIWGRFNRFLLSFGAVLTESWAVLDWGRF